MQKEIYDMESKVYDYLMGNLSAEGIQEVEDWKKLTEANAQAFLDYKRIVELSSGTKHQVGYNFDSTKAFQKFKKNIESENDKLNEQKGAERRASYFWVTRIAASLAILFLAYIAYSNLVGFQRHIKAQDGLVKYEMPDGSTIWISPGSEITYNSCFRNRKVELKGKAYFDIVKSEKPFEVISQHTHVEVLGTEFVVEEIENKTVLVVVSGKVAFSSGPSAGEKVLLAMNERAEHVNESGSIKKKTIDLDPNDLAWKTQRLFFDNQPLPYVLEKVGNHYDVEFKIENQALTDCRFSGEFDQISLNEVKEILDYSLSLEFIKEDNQTVVFGDGCHL